LECAGGKDDRVDLRRYDLLEFHPIDITHLASGYQVLRLSSRGRIPGGDETECCQHERSAHDWCSLLYSVFCARGSGSRRAARKKRVSPTGSSMEPSQTASEQCL